MSAEVYVLVRQFPRGGHEVEILDAHPRGDLAALVASGALACYRGNVNGGDSVRWYPYPLEACVDCGAPVDYTDERGWFHPTIPADPSCWLHPYLDDEVDAS